MASPKMEDPKDVDTYQRLQEFKKNDVHRQLIEFAESLVVANTKLSKDLEIADGDSRDQAAMKDDWKRRAEKAEGKKPFVLVLVDGDGYRFDENYVQNTDTGGADAALQLLSGTRECVKSLNKPKLLEYEVMVNVFANKRGLGSALTDCGVIPSANYLDNFFHMFIQSQAHFQFVDCGPWKGCVDAKVKETYRFFLQNNDCKYIFLAVCHDNGYLGELEKHSHNRDLKRKTRLVHHYAESQEFKSTPFRSMAINGVFSTRDLPTRAIQSRPFIPVFRDQLRTITSPSANANWSTIANGSYKRTESPTGLPQRNTTVNHRNIQQDEEMSNDTIQ